MPRYNTREDMQANYRVSPLLSMILMQAQDCDLRKPGAYRPYMVLGEILYGTFFPCLFHRKDDFSSSQVQCKPHSVLILGGNLQ
jgi:hypothetical protein